MPRGKQPSGNDTDGKNKAPRKPYQRNYKRRADFSGWVNVEIPRADKEKVDEFGATTLYADAMKDVIVNGHRISLSYDSEEEVFVATTFMTDADHPCAGLMVSQRSDDIWRALLKLVYAHSEILPEDYSGLAGHGGGAW